MSWPHLTDQVRCFYKFAAFELNTPKNELTYLYHSPFPPPSAPAQMPHGSLTFTANFASNRVYAIEAGSFVIMFTAPMAVADSDIYAKATISKRKC